MQHVFISYHHDDLDFAENVISRIEKAGYSTWTDDKLHAGEDWRAMIDIAIKNAFALIVIMTQQAKASEYVTYEWAFAWGVGVKVIPLMLRPTPLHPRLEALQYLDFTNPNPRNRPWDRLIEEIMAAAHAPLAHTINIPLNSPPYIRQAVMALDSPNGGDRQAAIHTLQRIKSPEAQTILIEALQHPIEDVRAASAEALGKKGITLAVPELIKLMHDPESAVRQAAANALGRLGDTTALPVLAERSHDLEAERLHDPDINSVEYKEVAIAMGRLGDITAALKLAEILGDRNEKDKYRVMYQEWREIGRIIGSLGDITVIPVLQKAVKRLRVPSSDYEQRSAAVGALKALQQRTDEDFITDSSQTTASLSPPSQ